MSACQLVCQKQCTRLKVRECHGSNMDNGTHHLWKHKSRIYGATAGQYYVNRGNNNNNDNNNNN